MSLLTSNYLSQNIGVHNMGRGRQGMQAIIQTLPRLFTVPSLQQLVLWWTPTPTHPRPPPNPQPRESNPPIKVMRVTITLTGLPLTKVTQLTALGSNQDFKVLRVSITRTDFTKNNCCYHTLWRTVLESNQDLKKSFVCYRYTNGWRHYNSVGPTL